MFFTHTGALKDGHSGQYEYFVATTIFLILPAGMYYILLKVVKISLVAPVQKRLAFL
jgi:hypothetical protein